ncbi:MAG TPA: CopG family transcriptional regulator [Thermoanaerobaculia bacterium]|nr:CopG family transcriptional regulator [Thermoanaerobaculia bacterium]
MKAAAADRSISDLVNEAVQLSLAEDAADLTAFEERQNEPTIAFDDFVKRLKRRGQL